MVGLIIIPRARETTNGRMAWRSCHMEEGRSLALDAIPASTFISSLTTNPAVTGRGHVSRRKRRFANISTLFRVSTSPHSLLKLPEWRVGRACSGTYHQNRPSRRSCGAQPKVPRSTGSACLSVNDYRCLWLTTWQWCVVYWEHSR